MIVAITGANRGIGLALTKEYINKGHRVYALCRHKSDELEKLDNCQIIEGIDVTKDCSKELKEAFGNEKIDLFINNAGILNKETFDDLDLKSIEKQLIVNSLGPIHMAKEMTPFMKDGSKIGVLTSRMGSIEDNTSGGFYGYRMSKAAANAGCKSLAIDLKPKNIAVGILHPGYVQTEMTNNSGDIAPSEAASGLFNVMEKVSLENTGTFWHSNGSKLPW